MQALLTPGGADAEASLRAELWTLFQQLLAFVLEVSLPCSSAQQGMATGSDTVGSRKSCQ